MLKLKNLTKMNKLTDTSHMPWGKHKGTAMANVPAAYLLWIYANKKIPDNNEVKVYAKENLNVLHAEMLRKN